MPKLLIDCNNKLVVDCSVPPKLVVPCFNPYPCGECGDNTPLRYVMDFTGISVNRDATLYDWSTNPTGGIYTDGTYFYRAIDPTISPPFSLPTFTLSPMDVACKWKIPYVDIQVVYPFSFGKVNIARYDSLAAAQAESGGTVKSWGFDARVYLDLDPILNPRAFVLERPPGYTPEDSWPDNAPAANVVIAPLNMIIAGPADCQNQTTLDPQVYWLKGSGTCTPYQY